MKMKYASISHKNTPNFNVAHLRYIATKYKEAEYNKGCGFSLWGKFPEREMGDINDWEKAKETIAEVSKRRTIYRVILSLDGETACEKNMNDRQAWQNITEKRLSQIAKEYNIKAENFCWCSSFHFKQGHPHTHIMFWDNGKDVRPEWEEKRFNIASEKVKEIFNKELFANELHSLYKEQDTVKKSFKQDFEKALNILNVKADNADEQEIKKLLQSILGEDVKAPIDNTLNTKILNDELLLECFNKAFFAFKSLPETGSLDYEYLPSEIKTALDETSNAIINTVLPFKTKVNSLFENVNEVCDLYGNTEMGKEVNVQATQRKLNKELGNLILKWYRKNKPNVVPFMQEDMVHSKIKLQESVKPILSQSEHFSQLLNKIPWERTPKQYYWKDENFKRELNLTVKEIMQSKEIKSIINENVLSKHGLKQQKLIDTVTTEKFNDWLSDNDIDFDNFDEENKQGIIENWVSHLDKTAIYKEVDNNLKDEKNKHYQQKDTDNKKNNYQSAYYEEYADVYKDVQEMVWNEVKEQKESWNDKPKINLSVNLIIDLSRLFKGEQWANWKTHLYSLDKSLLQRRNIRKMLTNKSIISWRTEDEQER